MGVAHESVTLELHFCVYRTESFFFILALGCLLFFIRASFVAEERARCLTEIPLKLSLMVVLLRLPRSLIVLDLWRLL